MVKDWKKEVARDCIALGSIVFYFIVIIRAIVGEYAIFVYQLLIALGVLIAFSYLIKKSDMYIARCFVLFVFTSLFYKHNLYTIFAFVLWVFVIISSNYLKVIVPNSLCKAQTKKNVIIKGIVLGIISSGVAYYLAPLLPGY